MVHNDQAGFTLVELIMVMVLLGSLSAVVIPKFFDSNTFSERAFFDDALNAIRYAQKLAVVSGCKVQVSISSNSYTLNLPSSRSDCDSTTPSYTQTVIHPGTQDANYTGSQSNVTLTSTVTPFTFDALGRASADVVLTVNSTKTINVIAATGLVYDGT